MSEYERLSKMTQEIRERQEWESHAKCRDEMLALTLHGKRTVEALQARTAELEAALRLVSRWREACHSHDADMGHPARYLGDEEEWDRVEEYANAALAPRSERREGEPAWTMQGCPECHGTGREGTGTPSGEGGEDFRECFRCQGTGFVPFPAPPAAPKEEA